jgi:hypothetical protein
MEWAIVKRNHGGEGAGTKSVYADLQKHLKAVVVMFKREARYDTENLDWSWAKYSPVGDIEKNSRVLPLPAASVSESARVELPATGRWK